MPELSPELRLEIRKLLGRESLLKGSVRRALKRNLYKMGETPAALLANELKRRLDNLNFAVRTIERSASLPQKK